MSGCGLSAYGRMHGIPLNRTIILNPCNSVRAHQKHFIFTSVSMLINYATVSWMVVVLRTSHWRTTTMWLAFLLAVKEVLLPSNPCRNSKHAIWHRLACNFVQADFHGCILTSMNKKKKKKKKKVEFWNYNLFRTVLKWKREKKP